MRHAVSDAAVVVEPGRAGGGLAWTDPKSGITVEIKARGLPAHDAHGFRELGLLGSFGWDPRPGSGCGPSLTLTMSASASGGVAPLFGKAAPSALSANDTAAGLDSRRFEAKLGYGIGAFGDRSFELRLDATRTEPSNDNAPEHSVGLTMTARW